MSHDARSNVERTGMIDGSGNGVHVVDETPRQRHDRCRRGIARGRAGAWHDAGPAEPAPDEKRHAVMSAGGA